MHNNFTPPLLGIIRESDAYPGTIDLPDESYKLRKTVRVMLEDNEGKFGFVLYPKRTGFEKDYFTVLGGGVHSGETWEQTLRREVAEEVGCEIDNIIELGTVFEYGIHFLPDPKNNQGAESRFYYAKVRGEKGETSHDEKETASDARPVWLSFEEALIIFKKQAFGHSRERARILFGAVKKLKKI